MGTEEKKHQTPNQDRTKKRTTERTNERMNRQAGRICAAVASCVAHFTPRPHRAASGTKLQVAGVSTNQRPTTAAPLCGEGHPGDPSELEPSVLPSQESFELIMH